MGHRHLAAGVATLFVLGLAACGGLSQDELDRVSADLVDARATAEALDTARTQLSNDLAEARQQLAEVRGARDKLESDLAALESSRQQLAADLEEALGRLAELTARAEGTQEARDLVRLLNGFFKLGSGQDGSNAGITEELAGIGAIKDPALKAKADAAFAASGTAEEDRLIGEFILLLMDTVESLLE
jgi:uncharacterized coiled-coil DUF342 family protein